MYVRVVEAQPKNRLVHLMERKDYVPTYLAKVLKGGPQKRHNVG